MTHVERRSINRLSVAAYTCIWVALALVVMLGVWGAYRDVGAARETALRKEIATIRSHAVRTVGRIERGLEQQSAPPDLATVREDRWIRQFWQRVVSSEGRRLYGAIVNSQGNVVMHSDPHLEGRQLADDWYDRVHRESVEDVFDTQSHALADGRRAYDIRVPIDVGGETVGHYHAGFDVDWFQEHTAAAQSEILRRWTIVIGGISVVVLLAGASLYYIASRSAAMRHVAAMAQLQRATELGQVAAGLAHEIRNPLHAIRLNLHALGRLPDGSAKLNAVQVSTIINESNEEIARLDRLIEELLGFAKPDELREEEIDLVAELRVTLSFISQEMQCSGVELRTRIPDQAAMVHMDPTRLKQIMLNLLMNAKEAAGEGGRIDVGLANHDERVEIRVSDDGPGIPEGDREHIFEPFYTTKEGGSGLGLALVKRFVEEADGRVYCDSNGRGTTFCLVLPALVTAKKSRSLVATQDG
jgi:signal transduction histidine kinase